MVDLHGHVVVITGASSGIGRLAAVRFARLGAHVLAAARGKRALETLVADAGAGAGSITAIPTDVTDAQAVARLADTALDRHRHIDTWINAAGVAMWARADETLPDEYRRILDVNVLGTVNGTLAAMAAMARADRGTIINVGSVESMRALPLQAAYGASKHAVRGFTDAVRAELAHDGRGIHVVLVMPSAMNTPIFAHARSRLGVMPRPHPPVYDPGAVVDAFVRVTQRPVGRVVVGGAGAALTLLERISPALTDRVLQLTGWRGQHSGLPDDGSDNLDAALDEAGRVHGSWSAGSRRRSWYTELIGLRPRVGAGLALGTVALVVAAARRGRR